MENFQQDKIEYTQEELDYRNKVLIPDLLKANRQRGHSWTEFDDMSYEEYYERNKKNANAYLRPKKNEQDTRIVTGTTHEKEVSLISAILQYNFTPRVNAYDKDNIKHMELGNAMEDCLNKSRQIERYDKKRISIYKEFCDQGTVFVEDLYVERNVINKTIKNLDWDNVNPAKIEIDDKVESLGGQCEYNLIEGTHMFLGNIKEFDIQKQPFIFTYDRIPYDEAKAIYGDWERFQYVSKNVQTFGVDSVENLGDDDWCLYEQKEDMVEVIKYQHKNRNEFMIMLNGVMMLPIKFPMLWGHYYNVAKGDLEIISPFFGYSKSIPSKTKVDQEVLDEMLRLIIIEMQKNAAPPMANMTGLALSKKIFNAGTITPGIDADHLQEIGDNKGVTPSHINGYKLIKGIVDSKSVEPVFTGEAVSKRQTATEVERLKRQQMMKLGLAIWGVLDLEWQLSRLRLGNIIRNWTNKISSKYSSITGGIRDVYRTIETEGEIESRGIGRKIINFSEQPKSPKRIRAEETLLTAVSGEPTKITQINPTELKKTLDWNWEITIDNNERNNDELTQTMWFQKIQSLANLFGPESLNLERLKYKTAVLMNENPREIFKTGSPSSPEQLQERTREGNANQSPTNNQRSERQSRGITAPVNQRQPSINKQA